MDEVVAETSPKNFGAKLTSTWYCTTPTTATPKAPKSPVLLQSIFSRPSTPCPHLVTRHCIVPAGISAREADREQQGRTVIGTSDDAAVRAKEQLQAERRTQTQSRRFYLLNDEIARDVLRGGSQNRCGDWTSNRVLVHRGDGLPEHRIRAAIGATSHSRPPAPRLASVPAIPRGWDAPSDGYATTPRLHRV